MKLFFSIIVIFSLITINVNAQPPDDVGCMLNESGQLRMYYGTNFKSTQGPTYRYIYTGSSYHIYSDGTTCPSDGKFFQFGAFYTEGGVPIGCHRTTDFNGQLGEMRYFTVDYCPIDDYIPFAIPMAMGWAYWLFRKKDLLTAI